MLTSYKCICISILLYITCLLTTNTLKVPPLPEDYGTTRYYWRPNKPGKPQLNNNREIEILLQINTCNKDNNQLFSTMLQCR